MKFECTQSDLVKVLSQVTSVSERKTTMPILGNILMEVKDNQLFIGGTDLEITIQATCAVNAVQNGKICTPAQQFLEIAKRLPKTTAIISKDEQGWLTITSGKAQFRISAIDAAEFPKLPKMDEFTFIKVPSDLFKTGFEKVSYAMSIDEMRYNLNGVYVEINKDELQMVSTDGHRLALFSKKLEDGVKIPLQGGVILPRKGVSEVKRILSELSDKTIEISITKSSACFKTANTMVFMKLVVGEFPDFKAILPKTVQKVMVVSKDLFVDSLKRVSLLSEGKSKSIKLTIKPDTLVLNANSPELGEAREEISSEFTADNLSIGFNAKYLLDALSVLSGDKVNFQLDHEQSPGVLRSNSDPDAYSVIMPMRI